MQQLRLFPRDQRLPVFLIEGKGDQWTAIRRRLRRSHLDVEVVARGELTPEMQWPGAGDLHAAAVVGLLGEGALDMPDRWW